MMFFLVAFSLLSMFIGYVWWRLILPAGLSGVSYIMSIVIFSVILFLPFVSIFLRLSGYQNKAVFALTWLTFLLLGFITMLFLFLVLRDVLLLVVILAVKTIQILRLIPASSPVSQLLFDHSRRQFLIHSLNILLTSLCGFLTLWGLIKACSAPKVEEVTIPINNLDETFDGFRIVQISDIHIGSTISRKQFQRIIDITQSLKGDLIALTGDLADGRVSTLVNHVAPLGTLHAPYGKFFVTGNHEYYSGVDSWVKHLRELGYDVLLNSHRQITKNGASIIIAGVTDYQGGHFQKEHISSPSKAKAGADDSIPSILLAHQPLSIDAAAKAGFDLVLSGHTHGGQYFPWNYFVSIQQPYVQGLHKYDNTYIYVNRGSAFWGPPLRGGVPAEITVLTLRKK